MSNLRNTMSIEPSEQPEVQRAQFPAARLPRRKVFFLLDSLEMGGTETQAVMLAAHLPASKYEVILGCLRAAGPLRKQAEAFSLPVVEFSPQAGIDSIGGVLQVLRLASFLWRERVHIVHCHDLWSNLMGIPAARLAQVPVISSQRDLSHLPWYKTWRRRVLRYLQHHSDAIVTNAEAVREQLMSETNLPHHKIRVVRNGVNLDGFIASSGCDRPRITNPGKGKRVVLIGNMSSDVKGHTCLIQAAPAVVDRFPDTQFVLVGDGPLRPQFESQAKELRLDDKFIFLGHRDDVPSLLAACDIAVLPSRAEGLPNALLEYMAAGLPIIASRVGGNAEIIQHDISGLLVPAQDPASLSQALLLLLSDSSRCRRLAIQAQGYVRRNFSLERLIDSIDGLYTELLHAKSAR
jgi:L-malate glycosyltransferase